MTRRSVLISVFFQIHDTLPTFGVPLSGGAAVDSIVACVFCFKCLYFCYAPDPDANSSQVRWLHQCCVERSFGGEVRNALMQIGMKKVKKLRFWSGF